MGSCVSTHSRAEKARLDIIDLQRTDQFKILLLGSSESGKTTIVKQMKIIHQNGFNDSELMSFRPIIYQNAFNSAQAVVLTMREIGYEFVEPLNRTNANQIFGSRPGRLPDAAFLPATARAIHDLWRDPIISKLMEHHSSKLYLMDNAEYFLDNALRIGAPDYLPTVNDVLRARAKTSGTIETRFVIGPLRIRMIDVGGLRSERKRWVHCFENVRSIIFCTALSDYDQVLSEEPNWNRMVESLELFESIVNSRWFLNTSIMLFLNKIDIFRLKLPKVPLRQYFPEYTGGPNPNKAAKYILWRFMQTNHARLSVYPHLIQATDTTNTRSVLGIVRETIVRKMVADCNIL